MWKIAITGGAGSGKSTVARMFQELGAAVVDADAVARAVVAPGQPAWEELRRAFGPELFQADGKLDRPKMAHRVFTDPEARRRLEGIVHPAVAREMARRLEDLQAQGVRLVMVEVPLLFEAGLEGAYDKIVVVYASPQEQTNRLKARDERDPREIAGMLAAQRPLQDKCARAHFVVDNGGTLADTRGQVEKIWQELKIQLDNRG